jgi:hypothetical protein
MVNVIYQEDLETGGGIKFAVQLDDSLILRNGRLFCIYYPEEGFRGHKIAILPDAALPRAY